MTLKDFLEDWNSPSPTLTVHTSGSTGSPKPMEVEKQKMLNSARITCDFLHLRPGDRALLCMSLDYIAGKMMVVRSLERGLRLVSVEPTGHPFATLAHEEPFDLVAMVPLQVYNSLHVEEERALLMRSRHLIIGGGAIDAELERELQNFPHAVWSTYGMTETLSHVALRRLNGQEASQWYKPFSHVGISQTADGCLVVDAPLVHDGPLVTNDRVEIHGNRF
ncbi:MAG: AMP-binding protein, partial [Prevotella sp.]